MLNLKKWVVLVVITNRSGWLSCQLHVHHINDSDINDFPVVGGVRWIDIVQVGEGLGDISLAHMNFIEFWMKNHHLHYWTCMMAIVPWFVSDFDANCVKEWCVTVTDVAGNWGILPWEIWLFWKMHNIYSITSETLFTNVSMSS